MENRNGRGVKGTLSCQLCRVRKQKCDFRDPKTKCALCVKQNQLCGPKQPPDHDKDERDKKAKQREYQKTLDQFIRTRLQRGQNWEDILIIMDPDGFYAPVPATIQPHHLQPGIHPSFLPNASIAPNPLHSFANETQTPFPPLATAVATASYPIAHSGRSLDSTMSAFNYNYNASDSVVLDSQTGSSIPHQNPSSDAFLLSALYSNESSSGNTGFDQFQFGMPANLPVNNYSQMPPNMNLRAGPPSPNTGLDDMNGSSLPFVDNNNNYDPTSLSFNVYPNDGNRSRY